MNLLMACKKNKASYDPETWFSHICESWVTGSRPGIWIASCKSLKSITTPVDWSCTKWMHLNNCWCLPTLIKPHGWEPYTALITVVTHPLLATGVTDPPCIISFHPAPPCSSSSTVSKLLLSQISVVLLSATLSLRPLSLYALVDPG